MTARLGSEYRYFGKLVLVPFRYFSIDTYRNIDIFDNTSVYDFLLSDKSNLSFIKNGPCSSKLYNGMGGCFCSTVQK